MTPALVALKDPLLALRKPDGATPKLPPNTVEDIVRKARADVEYARSLDKGKVPDIPRIEVAGTVAPRDGRTPEGRIISLDEMERPSTRQRRTTRLAPGIRTCSTPL